MIGILEHDDIFRPRTADPRAERSRAKLRRALLAELATKPLVDVRVGDVLHRGEVARSTFYRHYESLDALAAEIVEQAVAALLPECDHRRPEQMLRQFVRHVAEHRLLAESLLVSGNATPLLSAFMTLLAQRLAAVVRSHGEDDFAAELEGRMLAGAAIAGVDAWLRTPNARPEPLIARLEAWSRRL